MTGVYYDIINPSINMLIIPVNDHRIVDEHTRVKYSDPYLRGVRNEVFLYQL